MNPLYLYGESGVGKTEIVIRFANRYDNKVFFTTFSKSIKETIAMLKFVGEEHNADISIQYRINIELLRMFDSDAILIIDNFDLENNLNPDSLRNEEEYIELINLDMKIIFTTRNNFGIGIYVDYLNNDQLLNLMLNFYKHQEESEVLKEIIKTVQYNTLIVELCARTLNTIEGISPKQLLVDLQNLNIDGKGYKGIYVEKDRINLESQSRKNLIGHIRYLFHLSGLTFEEKQILSCAALLPLSGIDYSLFIKCSLLLSVYNRTKILSCGKNHLVVSKDNYIEFFFTRKKNFNDMIWRFLTRYDDKVKELHLEINSEDVVDRMIQKGWIQANKKSNIVRTTGLAGGLLTPYKGLLLAKPKGLLKKIPLLQYMLRHPAGIIFLLESLFFRPSLFVFSLL